MNARVLMVAAAALALTPACRGEVGASANTPAGKVGVQGNVGVQQPGIGVAGPGAPPAAPLTDGSLIKVGEGAKVYIMIGGLRRWIQDRATFDALGFDWNAVMTIPKGQMNSLSEGPAIATDKTIAAYVPDAMSKMSNRTLIRSNNSELTFLIILGQRHLIRDPATFMALRLDPNAVVLITPQQMAQIPQGPQW